MGPKMAKIQLYKTRNYGNKNISHTTTKWILVSRPIHNCQVMSGHNRIMGQDREMGTPIQSLHSN